MTEEERNRRFRAERLRRARAQPAIQRDTMREVDRYLREAADRIAIAIAGQPSDFERWRLPQLRRSVEAALREAGQDSGPAVAGGATRSWRAGADLVDEPLRAGGVALDAILPLVDSRQLAALRLALTNRITGVSIATANRINAQLGLVISGVQPPSGAASVVQGLIGGGRGRALTIVRTELGRAFGAATQERQEQAKAVLPGLQKQWRRSGKVFSRPQHDAIDGQIREVDEPFLVNGAALMFPRDPAGPAAETINCGCSSLPFMAGWEVSDPGRRAFTDEELARSPTKRNLSDLEA